MTKEFRHTYKKVVSGRKEFVDIMVKLMDELPGCFGDDPEILVMSIGDSKFEDDSPLGVRGIIVSVWIRNNGEYCERKLEEVLGSLEDWER